MTSHGDDCYFFYYSTCSKGDSCPFRHCEAAMGNETVCNLWKEGRCFRTVCKFRHMEITKNRKEIPCYWENQPAGCQKPHCAFFHEKARYIDGVFVPPSKSLSKNDEQPHEEPAPTPAAPLPTPANPQLRGVMKTETQEPVPSPTHPPVVINPADDDEDEDDQFSEEGEDGKLGLSPRKLPKSDGSLNFGVSTLEEIRLRKALKASMKRAGYPIQSADTLANGEKENIQSFFRPALNDAREDAGRTSVADRLGQKLPNTDINIRGFPMKRSLAERLGRSVAEEEPSAPPQKTLKPIKQRLGLPAGAVSPTQTDETNMESKKSPEQIRIKTLEEIRQEKVARSQSDGHEGSSVTAPETPKTASTKVNKGVKRAITVRDDSIGSAKTFSEILQTKKKRREEQNSSPEKVEQVVEKAPFNSQGESGSANVGKVRVKTLEEIRKEKAVRMQTQEAENKKSPETVENTDKKTHTLRINKLPSQSKVSTEKIAEGTEKPEKTPTAAPETSSASSDAVKVKTFDEIMREKRLRKQEVEQQERTSAERKTSNETQKRKVPVRVGLRSAGSSSPSSNTPDSTCSAEKPPVRKLIHIKPKTVSPQRSITPDTTAAAVPTVTSVHVKQGDAHSPSQTLSRSREVPDKKTSNVSALSPAKQTRAAAQVPSDEAPSADTTLNSHQKTSPENTSDTKVRPKLNVKPSVMKPAVQVKPGQKRKAAERSAVAAVKPLNSTPTVLEEPLQETPCRDRQVLTSSTAEAQLSSAVPFTPGSSLDSSSSPLREELQTVPVFKQNSSQETKLTISVAAPTEAFTVPQSPILKTPTQTPKPRRQSTGVSRTTAASTSVVDEFDELISEFTGDHLEDDVDPGLGEDDLLQELSEMIDS